MPEIKTLRRDVARIKKNLIQSPTQPQSSHLPVKGTGKEVVVQETETEIETRQIAADQTRIDQEIQEAAEEEIVKEVVIIEVIEKTKVITDQTGIEATEMGIGIVIGIGIEVEIEANIEAADEVDHVIDHVTESIIHADQGVRIGFLAGILTRKKTLVKALQGIKKWKEVTRKQAALHHLHLLHHQRQI